jgi:hypothetical protein
MTHYLQLDSDESAAYIADSEASVNQSLAASV